MKLNIELLKKLTSIPSPSGYTFNLSTYIKQYLEDMGYKPFYNQKGNLFVEVKGKSDYKMAISAHIDTLGLMIRSISNDGKIMFTQIGGPLLNTYDGEYCLIHTRSGKTYSGTILSTSPSVHVYKDARSKERDAENMYVRIDELVYSKNDVTKLGIQVGDYISINPKFEYTETGFVKTRFLDDLASAFLLLEYLRELKETATVPNCTLLFSFTTYEEVGHGCSSIPNVSEILVVDMGCVGLDLTCTEEMVSICAKDGSGPYDYMMTTKLISLAKENNLNYAVDIYPFYSSDGSAALRGGNDIKCALIGAGIHASHGMERTHKHGLENTYKLIKLYVNSL